MSHATDSIAFFDLGTFTEWRRNESGEYVPVEEVAKGHSSPVIYTAVADLDSDEAIRALVEKLLAS